MQIQSPVIVCPSCKFMQMRERAHANTAWRMLTYANEVRLVSDMLMRRGVNIYLMQMRSELHACTWRMLRRGH